MVSEIPLLGADVLAAEIVAQPETNTVRTGTVVTSSPLVVNIQRGGVGAGCGYIGVRPAVGDVVALVRQGESWLVLGKINPPTAGNGLVAWAALTASSANIGAETAVLTIPSVGFVAGRAYEIAYQGDIQGSIANNYAVFFIRRTNVAGTAWRIVAGHQMAATVGTGLTCTGSATVANRTASDITDAVVLTMQSFAGGTVTIVAATNRLFYLRVTDIGAAVDLPTATSI